jgi:KUP system potassium uptake protein
METPHIPRAKVALRKTGLAFDIMATSFFLGRRKIVPAANSALPHWQDNIFIWLMRNASDPTEFFHIPPGRVVEMGTQISI